jgi:pilus assembly protein Flp/PilA
MRQKVLSFFVSVLVRLHRQDEGQSMIEYGLIIALIAVVVVIALTTLGTNIKGLFTNIANSL